MPNVPNAPGVPALAVFSASSVVLLTQDVLGALAGVFAPAWGIFLDGVPVLDAESVVDFELRQDNPISDYQVEKGAFQSYDKVQLPTEIRVRVSAGGSEPDRASFLTSIDAVMNTTDLYDVLTPERTYVGYNFTHKDFRRSARNGVGLIIVDLWLVEVREGATASFSSTAQPQDAGPQGNGNAQPQAPSAFVQQNFDSGAWVAE